MKLLLVYPEIECSVTNTHTYSIPLGLGSIGTYCKNKLEDSLDVRILDGSMMSHDEQLEETKKFEPDVTGIAPTIGSQRHGYEIGELAKSLDSLVIFGGVHSTALFENMLKNRNFVDGVILFEGEEAMYNLLRGIEKQSILNLAYKNSKGSIHKPEIGPIDLKELPDIDYSLFDLGKFFEQTQKRGFGKAISYYAGKGCAKRGAMKLKEIYSYEEYMELVNTMNLCTFCGRNELGLRNFEEEREARIVRELHDQYSVRGFFNVQDTVNLNNTIPIGLNDSWFRLFIGTESITPKNIARLKQRYGSNLIFQAGIESADPRMRKIYGKKTTDTSDILSKAGLMREEGVQLHASFILGGRTETQESVRKTTEIVKKLAEYDNVTWILVSPQLILPGSPDYRMLLDAPGMHRKYSMQDLIDIVEINQDFLRQFTPDLTREEIIEEIKQTFDDIRRKDRKPVLDVKGVVGKEEDYINPSRPYMTS